MRYNLISVIIPIYNVEQYLRTCIDSVLMQTYKNLEIILVDDGSTDYSGEICDEYLHIDDRIQVIHKKNGGPSEARNVGLQHATGEYVYFIDPDDAINCFMLEDMLNAILENNAEISLCGYKKFKSDDELNLFYKQKCNPIAERYVKDGKTFISDFYTNKSKIDGFEFFVAWNKLCKRSLYEKNGIQFPVGKVHEDIMPSNRLYYFVDKVVLIDNDYYIYRQRIGSIMSSFTINRCKDGFEEDLNAVKFFYDMDVNLFYASFDWFCRTQIYTYKLAKEQRAKECIKFIKIEFGEVWQRYAKEAKASKLPKKYKYYLFKTFPDLTCCLHSIYSACKRKIKGQKNN